MVQWDPGTEPPTAATTEVLGALLPTLRAANQPVRAVTVEMVRGMARLIEQFPDISERRGDALREGYRDVLVEYPEDVALATLREARLSCTFVPAPGELRRIAAGLMAPRVMALANARVMAIRRRQEGPRRAAVTEEDRRRNLEVLRRSTAHQAAGKKRFGGTLMDDKLDRPVDDRSTAEAIRSGLIGASTFRLPPEDHPAVQAYLREMEKGR